jgi:iron complex outermembrane recepter protein
LKLDFFNAESKDISDYFCVLPINSNNYLMNQRFKSIIFLCATLLCFDIQSAIAQVTDTTNSPQVLETVTVNAYETNKKIIDLPASVVVVSKNQLLRFNNTSLVPVLNAQPGIRMEERSPGSYRLNIRGSSLRAPFGVRNVKVYYNNIPYTTPGGDSYFNQLGFYNVQSLEIIKGPGSSLYGAGTGGVLLLKSEDPNWKPGITLETIGGSYGLQNHHVNLQLGEKDFQNSFHYQSQKSDGYRAHTELKREVFSWNTAAKLGEKSSLQGHFLYGNLFYETPGGLTQREYDSMPKQARPNAGFIPGAEVVKAAIYQKTFFTGVNFTHRFNEHVSQSTAVYGALTQIKNPGIFGYGRASEPHVGGRMVWEYKTKQVTVHAGTELQQGFTNTKAYKNVNGQSDSLRTDDDVSNRQASLFVQGLWQWKEDWILTGGVSINQLKLAVTRLSSLPVVAKERTYNNEWAPRLALLKKLKKELSIYIGVSRGFSPPTSSEVLPSSGIISTDLAAEQGTNYELGSRGVLLKKRLGYDITVFYYQLTNAIVVRRDNLGRDFFSNAGATRQKGLETHLSYLLTNKPTGFLRNGKIWLSHSWYDFRYSDFIKAGTDFSGKKLPSVSKHSLVMGLDLAAKPGLYTNITYYYNDPIPLNDANTAFASSYHLLNIRVGWKKAWAGRYQLELFAGADNLTDTKYSLGNDINAGGGRYYNPAANRNFYGGIKWQILY